MGLVSPCDLPASNETDPLIRFARRFWRFACILRLRSEALYSFAKALLASKVEMQLTKFCISLLKQASSPTFDNGNQTLTLPPNHHPWQPEFSGNAALLLARLSKVPNEPLRRAIDAIDLCIAR